jgi:hypothetical protein
VIRVSGLTASICLWLLGAAGDAQIPGLQKAPSEQPQQPAADPLGRTTPRGTIASFIRAVDRNELASATQYLQLSVSQRANADSLARDLKTLLDRHFQQAITPTSAWYA